GEPRWLAASAAEGEESPAADLFALGRIAGDWAELSGQGGKSKPLPEELQAVLVHPTHPDPDQRFPGAMALLEELERAGAKVRGGAAWARLLEKVREQAPAAVRQSA